MTTELQTQTFDRGAQTAFIRDGVAGNYQIVYQMARIIRNSVTYDKGIEALTKQIEVDNKQDAYSSADDILRSIFNFVKDHVRYTKDIAGKVESLKDARSTLSDGYGDCDDLTNTLCTLAGCAGFEDVRIALAKYSKNESSFSHVYCVVYQDGKRYVLDVSLKDARFNKEIKPFEVREIGVFDDISGLDGVSGIVNNARYYGRKAFKTAVGFVPKVADYMPLGFVAGHAFSQGAEMIGQVGSDKLSINATASIINSKLDEIIKKLLTSSIALDSAQAQAMQIASQFVAVEFPRVSQSDYEVIKNSIKDKLNFIKNFEIYAQSNNIKVVRLNAHFMLIAGLALTGGVGYLMYDGYKNKRR
jgi:hypothetical protein